MSQTGNAEGIPSQGASLPCFLLKGGFYQLQRAEVSPPSGWSIVGATLYIKYGEEELVEDGIAGVEDSGNSRWNFDILGSHTEDASAKLFTGYTTFTIQKGADEDTQEEVADYRRDFRLVDEPIPLPHDQKILDLLIETLEKKLAGRGDVAQYTIGDRQISTMGIDQLRNAISYYQARVEQYPRLRAV